MEKSIPYLISLQFCGKSSNANSKKHNKLLKRKKHQVDILKNLASNDTFYVQFSCVNLP